MATSYNGYFGTSPLLTTDICTPSVVTASSLIYTGACVINRILCTASTSLVISVYDGTTTGGTKIIDSLAVSAKDNQWLNLECQTGLYIEVVSGSGKITVGYRA